MSKWVKASEQLPTKSGEYKFRFIGQDNEGEFIFFDVTKVEFFKYHYKVDLLEYWDTDLYNM